LELIRLAASEPLADRRQLLVGDPEPAVERLLGGHRRLRDAHRAPTTTGPAARSRSAAEATNEAMIPRPSSLPRTASTAVSGWGMSPATLPAAFITPAIARREPLGLARSPVSPAAVPSACA